MYAALREKAAGIQFAQKNGCCTDRVRQLFCLRKASKAGAWFPGRQAKYAGNMEEGMKKRIVSLVLALVLVLGLLPGSVMALYVLRSLSAKSTTAFHCSGGVIPTKHEPSIFL